VYGHGRGQRVRETERAPWLPVACYRSPVALAVLGVGGNLGARRALFGCARALLAAQPGLRVLAASSLYHTAPLGPPQPDYLNAALLVDWVGAPRGLLALTQHVEALLQRQRGQRWGPRTLDLDLLYWAGGQVREPGLSVPHRELERRSFALAPLLEVCPELGQRYRPALERVGGAPARAEAWMPRVVREGDAWVTDVCDDPLELFSALGSALAARFTGEVMARSTLPFACPAPGSPGVAGGTAPEALEQRLRAAFAAGFFVAHVAVCEVREGRLNGVFVGQHSGRPARLSAARVELVPSASPTLARVS
jgi:2-amino-4-hydroxy-6-hydroxymethyldihydropteridine diphosphokinase